MIGSPGTTYTFVLFLIALSACRATKPTITFTKIPAAGEGSSFRLDPIEGKVSGAKPHQQIVLYAKSGAWWIQPLTLKPFTPIAADSTWQNTTHPGLEYAALLVDSDFAPALTTRELPPVGGPVAAVAIVKGIGPPPAIPTPKYMHFSGYDWEIRRQATSRGSKPTPYDPANVSLDERGYLHLRTTRQGAVWAGAEVRLTQSLGQGLYQFTVQDVSHLDPADSLSMFTWDDLAADQHHREVDVEIGRWGDPSAKNAQFVVQPADEPANVVRFEVPSGLLTYAFRWEPGKVSFSTKRAQTSVASHEFASGVPSPGGEQVNISLFVFAGSPNAPKKGTEVIVEKFEYLP